MKEKVYQTDNGKIHYWVNEVVPERATLVFLPGLTADHRLFYQQIEFFEDKYNLWVWDAPGHGASRPFTLDFSLEDKAVFLNRILLSEGVSSPFMIGQSMGGYVAQAYMERFPHSVGGFISIDSAPLKRKYLTAAELWLLKRVEPVYRAYPWKALMRSGAKGCAESEYGRRLMFDMMSGYEKNEYCSLAAHGYKMLANAIELNRPYQIDCPALLLCGEHDKAGSCKRYSRNWTREEGIPLIWIKDAGHNSNTDNPQMVNRLIQEFVDKVHDN